MVCDFLILGGASRTLAGQVGQILLLKKIKPKSRLKRRLLYIRVVISGHLTQKKIFRILFAAKFLFSMALGRAIWTQMGRVGQYLKKNQIKLTSMEATCPNTCLLLFLDNYNKK